MQNSCQNSVFSHIKQYCWIIPLDAYKPFFIFQLSYHILLSVSSNFTCSTHILAPIQRTFCDLLCYGISTFFCLIHTYHSKLAKTISNSKASLVLLIVFLLYVYNILYQNKRFLIQQQRFILVFLNVSLLWQQIGWQHFCIL